MTESQVRDFIEEIMQDKFANTDLEYEVVFNKRLRTTAGRAWNSVPTYKLELNANLMKQLGLEGMKQTIAHELAHILVFKLCKHKAQAHGSEWRTMMFNLGFQPDRTHNLFEENKLASPRGQQRRWAYTCDCDNKHSIATVTHNRMQNRTRQYICSDCKAELKWTGKRAS